MSSSIQSILIASDHAGFAFKAALQKLLPQWGWQDLGPFQESEKVDYPDFAFQLCQELLTQEGKNTSPSQPERFGVLICGSGIGMSMVANRIPGIRAALVENPVSARLSREHNQSNVLCLGARILAPEYGAELIKVWLNTPFSGDPRHVHRIQKFNRQEQK